MNTDPTSNPLGDLTADLEKQLQDAKSEKVLAQIPVLRRLNQFCKGYLALNIIGLIFSAFTAGPSLKGTVAIARILQKGPSADVCLVAHVLLMFGLLALAIFQTVVYWRFVRQFKQNDVSGITTTAPMLLFVYKAQMVAMLIDGLLLAGIFQTVASGIGAVGASVGYALVIGAFFLVIRKYVRKAEKEFPMLSQLQGQSPQTYRTWTRLYLICVAIAAPVLAASYVLLPTSMGELGDISSSNDHSSPATEAQAPAGPVPGEGSQWDWPAASGWSDFPNKPENFTLLRVHAAKNDQLISGLIVEHGTSYSLSQMGEGIRTSVSQKGTDYEFVREGTVEFLGRTWGQLEFKITLNNLPLHYLYEFYSDVSGTYTLIGWSGENDFNDESKEEILRAFNRLDLK